MNPSESEALTCLIRKRGTMKGRQTLFSNYLHKFKQKIERFDGNQVERKSIIELEGRLEKHCSILHEFEEIQAEIDLLADDQDTQLTEREVFENTYYNLISEAKYVIEKCCPVVESPESVSSNSSVQSKGVPRLQGVKLPPINLQKFSGDYKHWLEFRDLFDSIIHSNPGIPNVHKFHYLRASLEGGAAQIIRSIEFCGDNYNIAWQTLRDRFENKNMLVHNHVKSLFSIPNLNSESVSCLREMVDSISKHLQSLKALNEPTEMWSTLLVHIFSTKLDKKTAREWEERKNEVLKLNKNELPKFCDFLCFLRQKADLLETLDISKDRENHSPHKYPKHSTTSRSFSTFEKTCVFCKNAHTIQNCNQFSNCSVSERIEKAKALKLCFNCLRQGHSLKECKSSNCRKCNLKHNTLLHYDKVGTSGNNSTVSVVANACDSNSAKISPGRDTLSMALSQGELSKVLLQTALVQVLDVNGVPQMCRALLDGASQLNLISSECCDRLGLRKLDLPSTVTGVGQVVTQLKHRCPIKIQSRQNSFECELSCVVIPNITSNYPSHTIDIKKWNIPKHLRLADPEFNMSCKIDLLIGGGVYLNLLCIGQVRLGEGLPTLQKTKFGWVLGGEIRRYSPQIYRCCLTENLELQNQLAKFWELEEIPNAKPALSPEEQLCEDLFVKSTTRDPDGRFIVQIPLKNSPVLLGDSRKNAEKRFRSLEYKLSKNQVLRQKYVDFVQEYESLTHMVKVVPHDVSDLRPTFYFPHHGVVNEKSPTTKLRVVFDGSAPSDSGVSFNDIQCVGPTIQDELFAILLRFRQHNIVLCADIVKMYRQILVDKNQWCLQRILWRSNPNEKLETYELKTITYGTASAPFLAVRCLKQLSLEYENTFSNSSQILANDFYMDDMITGTDTVANAIQICEEVKEILASGCFCLQKWASNSKEVLDHVRSSSSTLVFGEGERTKTLGLYWSTEQDVLMYNISVDFSSKPVSKRSILSEISQIFDPLGLLTPCTIIGKLILQKLWLAKLSWDETLPSDIDTGWRKFKSQLHGLNKLTIPRRVMKGDPDIIELHGFADASLEAYGACVYIRVVNKDQKISVRLLCAKSRVSPLKSVSVPRLELCASLLLAKLVQKVRRSMTLNFSSCFLWSDSTVTLSWITTKPNILQTFVSNRVAQIQSLTRPDEWNHVPTRDNPADVLSRGISPDLIKNCDIWWHGPQWLSKSCEKWPNSSFTRMKDIPEIRKKALVFKVEHYELFPFNRFSKFMKGLRVCAYCIRFINNCKLKQRNGNPLSAIELKESLTILVKLSQQETFFNEIRELQMNKSINSKGKLRKFNPFLDNSGVLRLGGRITLSSFNYEKKHPAILCSSHALTRLLFEHEHIKQCHAGPQHLLAVIREKFWPIRGRNLAKRVVQQCIRCFRVNPILKSPIMGPLPFERVSPASPFSYVGVDYAGPLLIRNKRGRGSTKSKCYIALFVCFLTKAVHLELVTDLTTEAFLAAFRRFVSRRGKPVTVFSDNGKNFIGAHNELEELGRFLQGQHSSLCEQIENQGVSWKFIPAFSPHFGGLWEAGIKSCKSHLKRVLANACLTYEGLYTVLCEIEAVLNSRPLTPLSDDPNDLTVLTPSHFLIGKSASSLPDPDLTPVAESRLSYYQRLQQLQQHFWARWSLEYISELQSRQKWWIKHEVLKPGALVVIKENNIPPLQWQLGRIELVHPGPDGVSRVATVKTVRGTVKRAFSKICVLPVEVTDDIQKLPQDIPDQLAERD